MRTRARIPFLLALFVVAAMFIAVDCPDADVTCVNTGLDPGQPVQCQGSGQPGGGQPPTPGTVFTMTSVFTPWIDGSDYFGLVGAHASRAIQSIEVWTNGQERCNGSNQTDWDLDIVAFETDANGTEDMGEFNDDWWDCLLSPHILLWQFSTAGVDGGSPPAGGERRRSLRSQRGFRLHSISSVALTIMMLGMAMVGACSSSRPMQKQGNGLTGTVDFSPATVQVGSNVHVTGDNWLAGRVTIFLLTLDQQKPRANLFDLLQSGSLFVLGEADVTEAGILDIVIPIPARVHTQSGSIESDVLPGSYGIGVNQGHEFRSRSSLMIGSR